MKCLILAKFTKKKKEKKNPMSSKEKYETPHPIL
jgi:hypothetical protein